MAGDLELQKKTLSKRLLDWLWRISAKQGMGKFIFFIAIFESIFFPIPPDIFLISGGVSKKEKVFKLATYCLLGSVIGGIIGYFVGYFFMDNIGNFIVNFYHLSAQYIKVQELYKQYDAWAVAIAALSPIPYKLCTLTSGAFKINFLKFIIVSIIFRGLRFYTIATIIYFFGEKAKNFLEKRFNLVVTVGFIIFILGFVVVKYI